jgi:20S proteasome alpha/beta subunit
MKNSLNDLDKKWLEPFSEPVQRYGKRKYKSPVTIISALACKDILLLAGDSRTTNEDGTIRDDVQKITTLEFQDGFTAKRRA